MDRTLRTDQTPGGILEPKRKADGSLLAEARVARPGIYKYHEDGEIVRELVPRETLYDPESLKTLGRSIYTDGHPPESVNIYNVDEFQAGDLGSDVKVDDDGFVRVKVAVRQADAIRNVLDGEKDQTSPGYHTDVKPESGEHPEFGEYDRVQTNRVYNHVAGVKHARGGPDCETFTESKLDGLDGAFVLPDGVEEISWEREDAHSPNDWKIRSDDLKTLVDTLSTQVEDDETSALEMIKSRVPRDDSTISRYLSGKIEHVSDEVANSLAQTLGTSIRSFADPARSKQDENEDSEPEPKPENSQTKEDAMPELDEIKDVLSDIKSEIDGDEETPEGSERLDSAMESLEEFDEKHEKLQNRVERLDGKLEALEQTKADDAEGTEDDESDEDVAFKFDSEQELVDYVEQRQDLQDLADEYDVEREDASTNSELKRAIVESAFDKDLEDAPEQRVDGMFEGLVETRKDSSGSQPDPNRRRAERDTRRAIESRGEGGSSHSEARESYEEKIYG